MAREPRTPAGKGPHRQTFDCTEEVAKQALGSSRLLSEIEEYACKSIAHRAESVGAGEFFIVRKAAGSQRNQRWPLAR